jgi:formate dehydrogenase major subunit
VPLDSTATGSNTPTSKSVVIEMVSLGTGRSRASAGGTQDAVGSDDGHKSRPEPVHLS